MIQGRDERIARMLSLSKEEQDRGNNMGVDLSEQLGVFIYNNQETMSP